MTNSKFDGSRSNEIRQTASPAESHLTTSVTRSSYNSNNHNCKHTQANEERNGRVHSQESAAR